MKNRLSSYGKDYAKSTQYMENLIKIGCHHQYISNVRIVSPIMSLKSPSLNGLNVII